MPPATCQARWEDTQLTAARPDWTPHQTFHTGLDAVAFVDAAARHLSGLQTLLADGNLILTTWPLTRAVVEHVAHAGWLLDPDITAEQRVARCWMIRLASAHRHRWLTKATRAPNARCRAAKRHRDQVQDEVIRRFHGVTLDWDIAQHPNRPPWEIAGQQYPGLGEATRRFIDYGGLQHAHGVYDLLSLVTHPNSTVLASFLVPIQHDGFTEYGYRTNLKEAVWPLRLAAEFLYRAGAVVCSYYQLDNSALEAFADTLAATDSGG